MSKFTFLVTNPDGTTISIHPISYRSEWPLNGHQTLTFRCFNGETINERATIKVYNTVSDMPVFCGWFTRFKRPSFRSGLPQQYNCAGFSKLLIYRYAFKTSYSWYETISSTITSLLKQANSMAIGWIASTYAGSPANTFCLEKTGTNPLYLPRLPLADPTIYLGSTLLTKGTGLSTLAANQWYRDTERIYIRTYGSNPNNYPCYITGFKDSHLVAGTLAANSLITPGITVPDEAIWTTFLRIVENQGLEYRFTNRTDGDQNVDASPTLYGGWYDAPVKTYAEADLFDFEIGTLEDSKFGIDSVVLRSSTGIIDTTLFAPHVWGRLAALGQPDSLSGGIYKEYIPYRTYMGDTHLAQRASTTLKLSSDERYMKIWTQPEHTLKCGDFIRVTLSSEPYDGQYNMRIKQKSFESDRNGDDRMELLLYSGVIT